MGIERTEQSGSGRLTRRQFLQAGILTLGSLFVGGPLMDIDNTLHSIKILAGRDPECSDPYHSERKTYPFAAVAILGGGFNYSANGAIEPNPLQKIRIEAGAIAYYRKLAPLVIFLGGMSNEHELLANQNYLQQALAKISNNSRRIAAGSIIYEQKSFNTASNIQELKKLMQSHNLDNALLTTNRFHLSRTDLLACHYGLDYTMQASEELIIGFDPSRAAEIAALYAKPYIRELINKELTGIMEGIPDPGARIYTDIRRTVEEIKLIFTSEDFASLAR